MKQVIWGTGYNAAKCIFAVGEEKVSFFIDSDLSREGKFFGKPILHSSEIEKWDGLYIYIPHNFYDEISSFLKKRGLKENINFTKYDDKLHVDVKRAEHDLESSLNQLREVATAWKNETLFICIHLLTKKAYRDYVKALLNYFDDLHLISEAYWIGRNILENEFEEKVVITPCFWEHYTAISAGDMPVVESDIMVRKDYLYETAMQIQDIFPEMSMQTCFYQAACMEKYIRGMLKYVQPQRIICYESVSPSHHMLQRICREENVPIIFTHPGIIPGTISFDTYGEIGESLPALRWKDFMCLPIEDKDLDYARSVWRYLYKSELNRKIQPKNDCIAYIKQKMKLGRPVIFFAGQNDVLSHMIPYNDISKKYHSPIFSSSLETVVYLAEICGKNDWNLVYKPHPMYTQTEKVSSLPQNIIFVEFGDVNRIIDFSDVTMTILSTTNYNALIRYKPVIMMGYTQTMGKGCTYEAFEKDRIEYTIKEALENGFTKEQQESFLRHIAQCLKYYLYDDLQERPIRYGRPIPKSISELYDLDNNLNKVTN